MDFDTGGGRLRTGSVVLPSRRVTPLSRPRKRRRNLMDDESADPLCCNLLSSSIAPNSPQQINNRVPPTTTTTTPNFPEDESEEVPGYNFERSYVVDYDRKNLDSRHIIIPFDQLVKFIDSNFLCKFCYGPKSTFERQTQGIATSLNWICCCGAGGAIKARIKKQDDTINKEWNESTWTKLLPNASYELNLRFVLGLQQCGSGEADSAVLAGMLAIGVSPFKKTWQ